ncbi:polymorphic toxin-type HINT domain-containing protein [Amycolatopsis sp. NPDC021455]|uniref:polymorphic toxin-type HINT domain-containing protein n=1 Tax=Amycolatopsis sp. NPDC021455 TaxID=3154901 RepID=UPI00340F6705
MTTTYHHPFYDVTRGAFVEAVDLQVGDRLQTADGGEATVEEVTPYHSTEVTYDLTIDELHTYYVYAGDTPVLVHNCGGGADRRLVTRLVSMVLARETCEVLLIELVVQVTIKGDGRMMPTQPHF